MIIKNYLHHPVRSAICSAANHHWLDSLSDEKYLKLIYYGRMGKKLNLKNPQTFNEKLQWLKLYDRRPEYTTMVDKYEAKKYVASIIGQEYIIPTLGVWDSFDDIDFDKLPEQFVLKCTHDSGGLVICRDKSKLDIDAARQKLSRSLQRNYYWSGREWPYKNVKPRIIAEKYMVDESGQELKDYKFFCFNGETKCFKIDFNRYIEHRANYYDMSKNLLPFGETVCPPDFSKALAAPDSFNSMVHLAEKLSSDFYFCRIDFYDIYGHIYFGELTFFPASGTGPFEPDLWDKTLGDWLKLPEKL